MGSLVTFHILSLLLLTQVCSPKILHITQGSTLFLDCLLGFNRPLLEKIHSWNHRSLPGQSQSPSHMVDLSNETNQYLFVPNIQANQKGTYECVTEGATDEQKVKLKAVFLVYVEVDSDLEQVEVLEAEVGENVELPCSPPTGHALGWHREIHGKKEDVLLDHRDAGVLIFMKTHWASGPKHRGHGAIILNNVTVEDSGTYHCYWDRHGERQEQVVELRVKVQLLSVLPHHCPANVTPWEYCEDTTSKSGKAILEESLNEFSAMLYSQLSKSMPSQNLLFSPISISWVLTHLLLGAHGSTRSSLEMALHLPHLFPCLHAEMRNMREALKGSTEIAAQIYYSPEIKLSDMFIKQSEKFYGSLPEKLSNSSEQNVKTINDWVAKITNQKITELVESISQQAQLVLLSAVYFKGKWQMQFGKATMDAPFVTATGDIVRIPVLYSSKYRLTWWHSTELEAQVAAFPLSGQARLFVLLPDNLSNGLENLESKMNEKTIKDMVEKTKQVDPQMAEVTLPKIKLNINTDLMELLESMGLAELFDNPNLCGLSSEHMDPPLALSEARHRAFLSLTETGVEAGAATAISFSRSFLSFSALRPFVFILWSDQANCPLFLGRLMKP